MLYGDIILIRVRDGKVHSVSRTLPGPAISIVVLNEDTNEVESPEHGWISNADANAEIDKAFDAKE